MVKRSTGRFSRMLENKVRCLWVPRNFGWCLEMSEGYHEILENARRCCKVGKILQGAGWCCRAAGFLYFSKIIYNICKQRIIYNIYKQW